MTWILGKIVGNPLVLIWIVLGAFGFGAATGGSASWWIQGVRITDAKQEFKDYQQQQTTLIQEAKDAADRQRDQARENFTGAVKILAADIEAGASYNRCLAAGKCGRVRDLPSCASIRLPSASGIDAASVSAISAPREPAPEVIADCANAVLVANQLQAGIESQPGYK